MYRQMLFEDTPLAASEKDLPCFIHGIDHSGASLFTVTYIADLYRQGAKLLFLSGYYMARNELNAQSEDSENTILLENEDQFHEAQGKRTIFAPREHADLFIKAASVLPDISERVILIKNIDLFDLPVYESIKAQNKLVISGDLDKCAYRNALLAKHFRTKILFSEPDTDLNVAIPWLEKYHGYLWTKDKHGIVSLM